MENDITITPQDAVNLLKLIDRALKGAPMQGGLNDLKATAVLITKLQRIIDQE